METWSIYFATLVGMQLHPRQIDVTHVTSEHLTNIIEKCALIADMMKAKEQERCPSYPP